MAQYWLDFEGDTIGTMPANWSESEGGTGFLGVVETAPTKSLQILSTSGVYRSARYAGVSAATVDVCALMQHGSTANSTAAPIAALAVRCNADMSSYYYGGIQNASNVRLRKKVDGAFTSIDTVPFAVAINTPYWLRLQAVDSTIRLKAWLLGYNEPESWLISTTDTSIPSAGGVGLAAAGGSSGAKPSADVFAIGTDGDPAPTGPVGGERQRSRLILTPW